VRLASSAGESRDRCPGATGRLTAVGAQFCGLYSMVIRITPVGGTSGWNAAAEMSAPRSTSLPAQREAGREAHEGIGL
jgi:hypothetical protein